MFVNVTKGPKDVIAQIVNYAAYVSKLDWGTVEDIARKYGGINLEAAYRERFGRPLTKHDEVEFRLLIVAESYDPKVMEAALFLINTGTPLALLQFTYFEVGDSKLFEMRTVLGEIPDQRGVPAGSGTGSPDEGYNNWLLSSVAEKIPDIARRQGWTVNYKVNRRSLTMESDTWPTGLGDCQLRLHSYKNGELAFTLYVRKDATIGLQEFIEARRDDWREAFPAEYAAPRYETTFSNLTYSVPTPEFGDTRALADIVERTERMAGVMVPLLDAYFDERPTLDGEDGEFHDDGRQETMEWTREKIAALKPDERGRLYTNARAQGTAAGDALAQLIEEAGLPFSEGGGINMDDPLVQAIAVVVHSAEGRAACEWAVAQGHPAIAGVDPLISERLGVDYGAHNMTTNAAGYLVAELMRGLGYRALGRAGSTPKGCVAGSGTLWEPKPRA